jgi:hypothetical protein
MQNFITPNADPELYRRGFTLICIGFVIPPPFFILDLVLCKPDWFAPSGALTLFFVAFVQLRQLSLLQDKHFKNAEYAKKGQPIHLLSKEYRRLERCSFWAGLYGTAIWAYGDKLVRLLNAVK